MKTLAVAFEKECERYKRAEAVVEWLAGQKASYPGLSGKNLEAAAVARVLEKGPAVNGMKGQLLEELGGASVEQMLGSAARPRQIRRRIRGRGACVHPGLQIARRAGSSAD